MINNVINKGDNRLLKDLGGSLISNSTNHLTCAKQTDDKRLIAMIQATRVMKVMVWMLGIAESLVFELMFP